MITIPRWCHFIGALCALLAATASAETPKTMKAIVAHEYGPADVLKYEDTPVPEPKENEILVRVIASGVIPPTRSSFPVETRRNSARTCP